MHDMPACCMTLAAPWWQCCGQLCFMHVVSGCLGSPLGPVQMFEAHGWVYGLEKLWQLHHQPGATGSLNPQACPNLLQHQHILFRLYGNPMPVQL